MDKEYVACMYNGILFIQKKRNSVTYDNMGGPWGYYTKDVWGREKRNLCALTYKRDLKMLNS